MKRIFILVVVTLLAVGSSFANESTLIDFSLLAADITVNGQGDDPPPNQNRATLMNFTNEAIGNLTLRQERNLQSSLAIENWDVVLAPSARNITSQGRSFTREAMSGAFGEDGDERIPVMGVRVHFPAGPFNSWARIQPPFDIPAFEPPADIDDDGTITAREGQDGVTSISRFEGEEVEDDEGNTSAAGGLGLVKNVGTIRSVAVQVYGLNFPHTLSVILIDESGAERIIPMGTLNFDGWGELVWNNPQYIANVRNRQISTIPIYPDTMPYVKFGGFLIQRSGNHPGGDFITYFKDVKIIYDLAVMPDNRDMDNEAVWNIIQERDTLRRNNNMQRFGQREMQRLQDLERQADPNVTFGRRAGDDEQE